MKHLISLSFKYIRRQKLRSVLTFLCIMLAVFIFNTYTAYLGSTIATLINFEKYYNSSHHVMLDRVLPYCEDTEEVQQLLENHAALEDHYFSNVEEMWDLPVRDDNGYLRYLDVQFDNGRSQKITCLSNEERSGTVSLVESQESIDRSYKDRPVVEEKNAVIFPYWVKELGYREGDTITMTITPVRATLSEDFEQVKEVREWIKQNSNGQTMYMVTDDPEEKEPDTQVDYLTDSPSYSTVDGKSLLAYILDNHSMDEVEFAEEIKGSPCTFTVKIAGFHSYNTSFYTMDEKYYLEMYSHPANDLQLEQLCTGENADFLTGSDNILRNWKTAAVRISENIDFDDGVMLLIKDLGLEEKHKYDLVFNDTLLAYEMRSANAIADIMPLIAAVLILALVSWLICRFVIDNAFEISVQERSAQFATLRIMGASRAQLVALIFTEALFYCLTAVPIGVIAAFMACKTVMELIGGTLFSIFTFDVNPWITALGIIISLSGILISAYTSAMWAARKLSPMEALQYGKPRKKAKKERHRKSVLKRKSFGFVLDYTIKNISRNKNRYVISTIAMTLGIVMFSFSVLGINLVNSMVEKNNEQLHIYDYQIILPSYKEKFADRAEELFEESGYFSEYALFADTLFQSGRYEEELEGLQKLMPDGQKNFSWGGGHTVKLVSQKHYEQYLQPVTGMTFEEFKALKGALLYVSSGGSPEDYEWDDESGQLIRKREDGYWTYQDMGLTEPPTVSERMSASEMPVVGSVCFDYNYRFAGEGTLMIADISILPDNVLGSMGAMIHLNVDGHYNYENAKAAIETFTSEVKGCKTNDAYMENTGLISFFNTIFRTLSIFLVSVWLVGILTMVNSINTSVLNRQKELLMLRSVGMTKRQLQLGVMLEGILYCLVSTIMGLLIGVLGYYVFINYIEWQGTGLTAMQAIILPITLTVAGTLVLNLLIAVISAVPALDSLSKRMK